VLVCQEGGYNTDYLGQHASGVVRALLGEEFETTKADLDAGFKKVDDVTTDKCLDWAVKNVDETKEQMKPFWKDL